MPISKFRFEEMQRRVAPKPKELPHCDEFEWRGLRFVIVGQIMGGKNNIIITRTGRRFPAPKWAKWRDEAVRGIQEQKSARFKMITDPVNIRLTYVAGDKRRRDMPAIIDAIFHVLEKASIVADDNLIWVTESSRSYDKDSPGATIEIISP